MNYDDLKPARKRFTNHSQRYKVAASGVSRREIPDDFKYNPKKVRHLKSVLKNVTVALGTLTSALNEFSRIRGTDISPDGKLGGVGYIMPLVDIKQAINTTVHSLSNIADCLADELTNPKWDVADDKDTKELIKEKDKAVEDVEEVSEDINPDDVTTDETEEKPETTETPEKEEPEAAGKSEYDIKFASAVKRTLVNFAGR